MREASSPELLHSQADLDRWQARESGTVAFVPTMGALHAGHLALVRRAREVADRVVVSIFVNPLQFGANEDFDKYPRALDADLAALEGLADAVFAPTVNDVYPGGNPRSVHQFEAGPVGEIFEGAARPGHFDGMLTVVARLFEMVSPDVSVFGQKDAQQVFLVRRLVSQYFADLTLEVVPTVRESDGLAMSSRNAFLSPDDRTHALVLNRALQLAVAHHRTQPAPGVTETETETVTGTVTETLAQMRSLIMSEPGVEISYVDAVDAATFESLDGTTAPPSTAPSPRITYIVAARVGSTRLLDTVDVTRLM